ncbi:putative bifunctional diguanylate cyclase/phosphodiesterase [Cryptosporangium aurantiacum]|uniref:Diguanylate cyclase (GGDEF) domain-containing protein n=1 Tax=Cryptosporangium aurantiacum TaxID=134849 RepID=A0A1M7QYF4_9ACTN|nr:EAL domain-containing protein [Cryptosporangium aurantiacum]SHN36876.1 diguanylate cyclase (GGDEF) domain-containing protein [Cryptosporangium aurantiacum]
MRRGWIAAAIAVVVYALVVRTLTPSVFELVDDLVLVTLIAWALVRYVHVGRQAEGRLRTGRRLGALAMGLWVTGLLLHTLGGPLGWSEQIRTASLALFSIPPSVCAVGALLALPVAPPTRIGKIRLLCDGAIIALSLSGLIWMAMGHEWYAERHVGRGAVSLIVLCLILVMVVSIAVLLLVNGQMVWRSALTGLTVGGALVATSMVLEMATTLRGDEWEWGHVLAQLGAVTVAMSAGLPIPTGPARDRGLTTFAAQGLPYFPLLVLGVFALRAQIQHGRLDTVVVGLGTAVVVAILGRQFLTLRMTTSLSNELGAQRARLAHQAYHDPLTGLANRTLFSERLETALLTDLARPALLLVDLDGFKAVNDTRGHATGDQLLVAVAGRLRSAVRATDTVARLGGDEFAVLLPGMSSEADAVAVATVILERVGEPASVGEGGPVTVRASVGIALADDRSTADLLLRDADLALYEAKESGKNRYRVADQELSSSTLGRLRLEEELRGALDAGEFEVHYQPIVELASERITAVEALLRWRHPTRGLLGPGAFLESAETAGLLSAIDGYVLRTACHQVAEWRRHVAPKFVVSVNVCAAHLVDTGLVDEVAAALADADVPAEALMLEVTETALVADLALAARTLRELSDLGVRIALDDFGTGYSSLTYLRTLPIHAIKIDRSFVHDLDGNPTDEAVTRAILGLAETLGLRPVAEGVEGVSQADRLRDLRCGHAQGFLFAKPMPPTEITELLIAPAGPLHTARDTSLAQ